MGSIGASLYRRSIGHSAAALHLPAKALDSVGATLAASNQLPSGARQLASAAASRAFIHGLDLASLVGVFVALAGAATAARFLPPAMRLGADAATPTDEPGERHDTQPVPTFRALTEVDV
jgi:hypothetical protein